MASKRPLLSTVGVMDVAHLMDAFQELNSCILSLSFEVTARRGVPDLIGEVSAYTVDSVTAERVRLASSRSSLYALNCATFEGAVTRLLYQLDGLLAAEEFSRTVKKP